jgi:hypothetical protein
VQLGQIHARPRYTERGAARGHAEHDPRAQRGAAHDHAVYGLGRSQRARSVCAALVQLGLGRAARAARGARRTAAQCAAALLGDGRRLDAGARRRRGGGGSPARRRRHGVTATSDGRARGAAAAATARLGRRARGHGRSERRRRSRGDCRWCGRGGRECEAWSSGARSASARRLTSGARLSAISELKFTRKEIISN